MRVPLLHKYAAAPLDSYLGASFVDKQQRRSIGTFKFALDAGLCRQRQLSHFVTRIANMALGGGEEAALSARARVRQGSTNVEFVRMSCPKHGSFWEGVDTAAVLK